jgi:hypothetical protein
VQDSSDFKSLFVEALDGASEGEKRD